MRRGLVIAKLALLLLAAAPASRAQPLVADLSDHLIAVTAGFSGAKLLLFGALDAAEANDVVVVINGPSRDAVVRRKGRVAGVWVNRDSMRFSDVPTFYYVASNRPLDAITAPRVLARRGIGLAQLRFEPASAQRADMAEFHEALIRNREASGLFNNAEGKVQMLGGRLFRTDVVFPSNVPTGSFNVTTYLFRNGEVVSAQSTPLIVSKVGVGARVFEFAQRYSALYGITAIAIALLAGWLAGAVFRKS